MWLFSVWEKRPQSEPCEWHPVAINLSVPHRLVYDSWPLGREIRVWKPQLDREPNGELRARIN
jgi:hypothetical protein